MYDFWDEVKKVVLGLIAIVIICLGGNWFINNALIERVETHTVYGNIYDIKSSYNSASKVRDYRVYMDVDGEEVRIKSPRIKTKEMYKEKDKYISTRMELVKSYNYNRKGKLINIYYKFKE